MNESNNQVDKQDTPVSEIASESENAEAASADNERRSMLQKMKDSLRKKLKRNKKEDPNIYPLY